MIEYDKFRMSLKRLEKQYGNYRQLEATLPELIQEAIAESVIQRFEIRYDCLWKVLRRYLIEELGLVETPNSPKPLFKLAHENELFDVPLERWLSYADRRVGTTHTTAERKRKPAWTSWTTSLTTPSASSRL